MGESFKKLLYSFTLISVSITMAACGGSGDSSENSSSNTTADETVLSEDSSNPSKSNPLDDENIASAIYYNQRTPDNFYQEPERDRSNYYIIKHIKNHDVSGVDTTANRSYELCSQDFTQALLWSEEQASNQTSYNNLVDNTETDLFYEFVRVNSNSPNNISLSRIFKCNLLDKTQLSNNQNDIGYISGNKMTAGNIQNLIAYLWTISPENNFGYAVLDTNITEQNNSFTYSMSRAKVIAFGASGSCDTITVENINYNIDKLTGLITKSEQFIKSISTIFENDHFRICDS